MTNGANTVQRSMHGFTAKTLFQAAVMQCLTRYIFTVSQRPSIIGRLQKKTPRREAVYVNTAAQILSCKCCISSCATSLNRKACVVYNRSSTQQRRSVFCVRLSFFTRNLTWIENAIASEQARERKKEKKKIKLISIHPLPTAFRQRNSQFSNVHFFRTFSLTTFFLSSVLSLQSVSCFVVVSVALILLKHCSFLTFLFFISSIFFFSR